MREILFRGKCLDNGEWVEGSLTINHYDRAGKLEDEYRIVDTCYGLDDEDLPTYQYGLDEAVVPSTVGQYTGLTDKNGKKIFEGDIVMTGVRYDKPYSKSRKEKRLIGKVEHYIGEGKGFFNDNTGKWDAHKMYSSEWKVTILNTELDIKYCCYTWGDFFDCEVIGNIYDNPEMIGGEKQ